VESTYSVAHESKVLIIKHVNCSLDASGVELDVVANWKQVVLCVFSEDVLCFNYRQRFVYVNIDTPIFPGELRYVFWFCSKDENLTPDVNRLDAPLEFLGSAFCRDEYAYHLKNSSYETIGKQVIPLL
jgi:hypothetical protein